MQTKTRTLKIEQIMRKSTKLIAAICAFIFVAQISFAQTRPVYDLKTQKKIAKIEQNEVRDIEKAKLEIDKTREKATKEAEKKRSEADAAKERAEVMRANLDSVTLKIQTKSHEDVLALTSLPYQTNDQVKEIKDREKKISIINKEAIKNIERIKKDTEKAENEAEKTERNALKAQQSISESVRKAEENADKKILKIRNKTRDQVAKLQPILY